MRRFLTTAVAVAVLLFAPSATADDVLEAGPTDTPCVGTLPPGTYENVVVPPGVFCMLTGSIVRGNVKALRAADLWMLGNEVRGDVQGFSADNVQLGCAPDPAPGPCVAVPNLIGGNIDLDDTGPRGIRSCGSVVSGNILVTGSRGTSIVVGLASGCAGNTVRGDIVLDRNLITGFAAASANTVDGDIYLLDNEVTPAISHTLRSFNNRVRGNLHFERNRSGDILVLGNQLESGNLAIESNSAATRVEVADNRAADGNLQYRQNSAVQRNVVVQNDVGRNLLFYRNVAGGSNEMNLNRVEDTLTCWENTPAPLFGGNVAQTYEGQCPA